MWKILDLRSATGSNLAQHYQNRDYGWDLFPFTFIKTGIPQLRAAIQLILCN